MAEMTATCIAAQGSFASGIPVPGQQAKGTSSTLIIAVTIACKPCYVVLFYVML